MEKLNRIIKSCIVNTITVFAFFTLLFPLVKVSLPYYTYNMPSDNGFSLIGFNSAVLQYFSGLGDGGYYLMGVEEKEAAEFALGIGCIIILLLLLTAMALGVVAIFLRDGKKRKRLEIGGTVIAGVAMLAYCVVGIAFLSILKATLNMYNSYAHYAKYYSTLAYVPLLVGSFLIAFYFIWEKVISPKLSVKSFSRNPSRSIRSEQDKTTLLLEYKQLLDMGAINQQEFDRIKARLLFPEDFLPRGNVPEPWIQSHKTIG